MRHPAPGIWTTHSWVTVSTPSRTGLRRKQVVYIVKTPVGRDIARDNTVLSRAMSRQVTVKAERVPPENANGQQDVNADHAVPADHADLHRAAAFQEGEHRGNALVREIDIPDRLVRNDQRLLQRQVNGLKIKALKTKNFRRQR